MAAFFGTPAARAPAPRRRGSGPAEAALMVRVPGREAQGTALGAMGRQLYNGFLKGFARSYTVFYVFRMVLYCFLWVRIWFCVGFYMVLYGFIWFYMVLYRFSCGCIQVFGWFYMVSNGFYMALNCFT